MDYLSPVYDHIVASAITSLIQKKYLDEGNIIELHDALMRIYGIDCPEPRFNTEEAMMHDGGAYIAPPVDEIHLVTPAKVETVLHEIRHRLQVLSYNLKPVSRAWLQKDADRWARRIISLSGARG